MILRATMILAGLTICACSRPAPDRPASGADGPVQGGELIVAIQSDGRSLDPHRVTDAASMRLIENLYGTLMRYTDVYGEVEPYLAQSYAVSDDGLDYTFVLREGITFHQTGRAMNAEDVVYSINRIIEQEVRAEQFAPIESMRAADSHTVVIRLKRPVAPFLTYLAYPMNAIVDREVVESNSGSLDSADAGSGPFRLMQWRKDRHLILERYEGYHETGRPLLDRIVFRPVSDETARMTALRTREIHLSLDVPEKDRSILERAGHIRVASVPGTFWEYLGLNTRRPPLDDPRVRQAVAWAVDRDMVNTMVKFGRARVLRGGFLPPNHWAYTDWETYPERDMERARALLAEAGYAGETLVLRVGSAFPYQVAAAQVVKQNLESAGFEIEILAEESGVFFEALNRGDFDMTLVGWLGFVDPDEWLYNIFHSDGRWNQQSYRNADVDRWLEQGRVESDPDTRKDIYRRAQQRIIEDAPVVLLYLNEQTSAWLDNVQGYRVHPTATTRSLSETWLTPLP